MQYVRIVEPLSLAYVTKLQLLLGKELNQYESIFDINHLPYNVACIVLE